MNKIINITDKAVQILDSKGFKTAIHLFLFFAAVYFGGIAIINIINK